MSVRVVHTAPYADVSIMVLPRIANPFIPFEGCAGSSPVVRAKWRDSIRGQYNGLVNRWCGIIVHSRLHLPPQYKGKYKALVMLRSQFDSVWWLQSLADETCRVPERGNVAFGDFVENKAGNIYVENGSLVQREEHSFGMGEVAISTFARASIRLGVKICDQGTLRLPESILVSEGTAEPSKYVSTLGMAPEEQ